MTSLAVFAVLFAGCSKSYDNSDLQQRVDELAEQVDANATLLKQLQAMLENPITVGLTVTVTEVEGGTLLTFSDGTSFTIPDGAKGDKGEKGDKGDKGDPGQDATTAVDFSVTESADGSHYIFKIGDQEYTVKRGQNFSLKLTTTEMGMAPGETAEVSYVVTAGDETVRVIVAAQSGYEVKLDQEAQKLILTAPLELPEKGFVVLTAVKNSTGEQSSQYLSILRGQLTVTADAEVVEPEGGYVTLTVQADCDYTVNIPDDCDWIRQVTSKAEMKTTEVYLQVDENTGKLSRTAEVTLHSIAGDKVVAITQKAVPGLVNMVANLYNNESCAYAKVNWSEAGKTMASEAKSFTYEALLWVTYSTDGTPVCNDGSKLPAGYSDALYVLMGVEYGIQFRYWAHSGFGFDYETGLKDDRGVWMALVCDGGGDAVWHTTDSVDDWTHQFDEGQYPNQTWYHWAVTYDYEAGVFNSYIDGKLVHTEEVGQCNLSILGKREDDSERDRGSFYIGYGYEPGKRCWPGCVSEVRVWDRALSSDEINAENHFYNVDPEAVTGLIGYWKFNEGEGGAIKDYSGNGNDAEVVSETPILWQEVNLP